VVRADGDVLDELGPAERLERLLASLTRGYISKPNGSADLGVTHGWY
jgi:hypothetical protein